MLEGWRQNGYKFVEVNGVKQQLGRLIYSTYHNVELQTRQQIDHIDRNKLNNSIFNLRLLSNASNNQNKSKARSDSKTGVKGVSVTKDGRFRAVFRGKSLGIYSSLRKAALAFVKAAEEFNSEQEGNYPIEELRSQALKLED